MPTNKLRDEYDLAESDPDVVEEPADLDDEEPAELDDEEPVELDDALEVEADEVFDDVEDEVEEEDEDEEFDEDEEDSDTEALDELEAEELELLEEEVSESLLVDEVAELRAIRREELTMNVEAQAVGMDEFICSKCFLVKRTSQRADHRRNICVDCAS